MKNVSTIIPEFMVDTIRNCSETLLKTNQNDSYKIRRLLQLVFKSVTHMTRANNNSYYKTEHSGWIAPNFKV